MKALAILLALSACTQVVRVPASTDEKGAILEMVSRTVKIEARECADGSGHSGSGVILSSGLVATARHVIDRKCTYTVIDSEGKRHVSFAPRLHDSLDIGVIASLGVTVSPKTKKAHPVMGEPVVVIGYPYDLRVGKTVFSITRGNAAAWYEDDVFKHTAPTYYGNSGGPVFNMEGELVGIISSGIIDFTGIPYDGMYHAVDALELDSFFMKAHSHDGPKE